jgi:hypothetical protein
MMKPVAPNRDRSSCHILEILAVALCGAQLYRLSCDHPHGLAHISPEPGMKRRTNWTT